MLWTSDLVKGQIKAFFPKFYFAYLLKANVATTSVNSSIDRRSDWGSWPGGCILFFINSTPPFGRSGSCRLSWGEQPLQWRKTIFLSWVCAVIWDSSRQQPSYCWFSPLCHSFWPARLLLDNWIFYWLLFLPIVCPFSIIFLCYDGPSLCIEFPRLIKPCQHYLP